MSRAYRKWKEDIKAYKRGELPKCKHDYNILHADTSMAAYRKIRRVRQRELKRMNKVRQRFEEGIIRWLSIFFYIPRGEEIRQTNEYWRQKNEDNS